jgi:hypothetical protein
MRLEFFKLAMLLEDLSVRMYKGSLPAFVQGAQLSTVMRIHSVEGRHASIVRVIRNSYGVYDPSGSSYVPVAQTTDAYLYVPPWPAIDEAGGVDFADYSFSGSPVYAGGLSQQDVANGTSSMAGIYGPRDTTTPQTAPSIGEDNTIQSSSEVTNVVMAHVNSTGSEALDEPMSPAAAAALLALFGVV